MPLMSNVARVPPKIAIAIKIGKATMTQKIASSLVKTAAKVPTMIASIGISIPQVGTFLEGEIHMPTKATRIPRTNGVRKR